MLWRNFAKEESVSNFIERKYIELITCRLSLFVRYCKACPGLLFSFHQYHIRFPKKQKFHTHSNFLGIKNIYCKNGRIDAVLLKRINKALFVNSSRLWTFTFH